MIPMAFALLANHLWQSTLFAVAAGLLVVAATQSGKCAILAVAGGFIQVPAALRVAGEPRAAVCLAVGFAGCFARSDASVRCRQRPPVFGVVFFDRGACDRARFEASLCDFGNLVVWFRSRCGRVGHAVATRARHCSNCDPGAVPLANSGRLYLDSTRTRSLRYFSTGSAVARRNCRAAYAGPTAISHRPRDVPRPSPRQSGGGNPHVSGDTVLVLSASVVAGRTND